MALPRAYNETLSVFPSNKPRVVRWKSTEA